MSILLDACQISAEKIKKTQTLRKKNRVTFKALTNFWIFFRYAWGFVFVIFNYWQFDPIYFLIN